MKIIREGNKELSERKRKRTKEFICGYCGCIFQADSGEYSEHQLDGISCKCPCCGEYTCNCYDHILTEKIF